MRLGKHFVDEKGAKYFHFRPFTKNLLTLLDSKCIPFVVKTLDFLKKNFKLVE